MTALFEATTGLSAARNAALAACSTDYIVYLDDDAIPDDKWASAISRGLSRYRPDFFGGPYRPFYLDPKPDWYLDIFGSAHLELKEGVLPVGTCLSGGNMGWRVALLRELGGFRPDLGMVGSKVRLGEETELQARLYAERETCGVFLPDMSISHYVDPAKMAVGYSARRAYTYGWQLRDINPRDPAVSNSVGTVLRQTRCGLPLIARIAIRDRVRYRHWKSFAVAYINKAGILYGALARKIHDAMRRPQSHGPSALVAPVPASEPSSKEMAAPARVDISVIVCAHNPREYVLRMVLDALVCQADLEHLRWEIVLVDNASSQDLMRSAAHYGSKVRVVREEMLGLTYARLRGFRESSGQVIVFVDDDNILDQNYLISALDELRQNPKLGAIGGKALGVFEANPPSWFAGVGLSLGCRDLGDTPMVAHWTNLPVALRAYPDAAPIGAGLVVRRDAFLTYALESSAKPQRMALGRSGKSLASGEDNDLVMTLLGRGWWVGYAPNLILRHMIPAARLELQYLSKYAQLSNRTWVLVLSVHGILPWGKISRLTKVPRKIRAFLVFKAWQSDAAYLHWKAACGIIDGRAALGRQ